MDLIETLFPLFMVASIIAVRVLFAMAAYNDALSKMNQNALMWGLLIGFVGLIPGIIYLCVRNNSASKFILCRRCGFTYFRGYMNCPKCGEPNLNGQDLNPLSEQQRKRAEKLCIAAGVLIALEILLPGIINSLYWF
jgi:ribosomal protein L37E